MTPKAARIAFMIFFSIMVAVFLYMATPLMKPAFLAAIIATIFFPVYQLLLKWLRGRNYVAALLTTVLCFCIVLLPLAILLTILVVNVGEFVSQLVAQIQNGSLDPMVNQIGNTVNGWIAQLPGGLDLSLDLRGTILTTLKTSAEILYEYSPRVLASGVKFAIGLIFLILFLVVFFAEGSHLSAWLLRCLPLSERHQREISRDMRVMISALIFGVVGTALAQGVFIGIGMSIAGINNAGVWTLIAILAALIPIVGAAGFYTGVSVVLAATGSWKAGVLFFAYGLLIISSIDNFVRPMVMGSRVRVHPILLFIALLGGMRAFGPIGVVVGPVLLGVFLTSLRIYQREFADVRIQAEG